MAIPEGLASYAWVAVCAVVAPAVFGLGIVRTLGLRPDHGRRVSWAFAYLAGHYVLAHATLLWALVARGVPGVLLPVAAVTVGIWLLRRAAGQRATAARVPPSTVWDWLPAAVLIVVLLHDCLHANVDPIRISDEAQIWAAKAKVLYGARSLDSPLAFAAFVSHPDYPLLDPLVQVLSFASVGRVLHFENRLPIQFFAVALLALLSAAMTRRAHPLVSALALIAFAGTLFGSSARTAGADVLVSFATLAAVEALLRLRETGARVWWRLACLAVAAMLASKNEGALLALAVALPFGVGWLVDRRRATAPGRIPRAELAWLLLPVAALALQQVFNRRFDLRNDLFDPNVGDGSGLFGRMLDNAATHGPAVAEYYGRMLVDPALHRLLPLAFVAAMTVRLCMHGRQGLQPSAMLCGAVAGTVLGYMLVFVGTYSDLQWHLSTAAARTMQQIVPVAALGLCLVTWPREHGARPGVPPG